MEPIPAIDLLNGAAVRLQQGDYAQVSYYDVEPAELASRWRDRVRRPHVVDLEGARQGRPAQCELVGRIARAFGPGIQVGGSVRSMQLEEYLALGAARVVLGTAALLEPDCVERAAMSDPERIIVAVDARNGLTATHGWQQQSGISALEAVGQLAVLPLERSCTRTSTRTAWRSGQT
jgi:phosphoribosylformimino-5-aminoimidazole carboxamide ribotide isomerase